MKILLIAVLLFVSFFSNSHEDLDLYGNFSSEEKLKFRKEAERILTTLQGRAKLCEDTDYHNDDNLYRDYKRKRSAFKKACEDSNVPGIEFAREQYKEKSRAVTTIQNNIRNLDSYKRNEERYNEMRENVREQESEVFQSSSLRGTGVKIRSCADFPFKKVQMNEGDICRRFTEENQINECKRLGQLCINLASKLKEIEKLNPDLSANMVELSRDRGRFQAAYRLACIRGNGDDPKVSQTFNKLMSNCFGVHLLIEEVRTGLVDLKGHSVSEGRNDGSSQSRKASGAR